MFNLKNYGIKGNNGNSKFQTSRSLLKCRHLLNEDFFFSFKHKQLILSQLSYFNDWRKLKEPRKKKPRNSQCFLKEHCEEKKSFRIIREKFVIKAVLTNKEHFSPIFLFISVRFYLLRSISYSIMIFVLFFQFFCFIFSFLCFLRAARV